jgi:hypothetical protein
MKRLLIAVPVLVTCIALTALAEKPTVAIRPAPSTAGSFSMGELTPTPEMWFYEQYLRQYQDPKAAVRANAEFRAEERQRRINALKWFGFSNQRPRAGVDAVHSDYSPMWASGQANYPFRWSGTAMSTVVINSQSER